MCILFRNIQYNWRERVKCQVALSLAGIEVVLITTRFFFPFVLSQNDGIYSFTPLLSFLEQIAGLGLTYKAVSSPVLFFKKPIASRAI